ncbi:TPA: cobalamin-binding protein, partial [Candidatus Bathyarchaeota archaeon]|nr:cobalamin-binding protein [Candidatus Bathyarchaeota archaeon]
MMEREILAQIARSVVDCDVDRTKELARRALEEGLDPLEAIEEGLARGIRSVGDSFARGEAFLPDLMMAAEAMKAGLSVLEGAVKERGLRRRALGKVVIGTVEGDLHDIGKSIVVTMLEANGFEVLDLGVDVPCRRFVEAVKEERPDVLGLSALLTSTLPRQREVIEAL